MFQIKPPKLVLLKFAFKRLYALKAIAVVAFISLVFASIYLCYWGQSTAYAATDSTVNFQARLMNATGSIVPDGCYNIQFKLYNVATGGSPLWTESYTNATATTGINGTCIAAGASSDDRLQVINGYVTVPLGSLTAFPTTINWNQSLYLTMNVGGTTGGAITYDGEMTPRLQLTAVPYAFQAGQLASSANSGGYNSTLSLVQPASGVTGNETFTIPDQGAAGAYTLLTSTAANAAYIQNGTSLQASSNFNISGTGQAGTGFLSPSLDALSGGTLTIGGTNATTITIGRTAAALNLQGSAVTISSAAAATFSTVSGNLTLQAGSGTVTLGSSTTLTATGALGITSGGANALTLDTGGGAALNIGGTNATSIAIGHSGVTTTVTGNFTQLTGNFSSASTAGASLTAGGAITITAGGGSTWSATGTLIVSGTTLTLQTPTAGSGTVNLGLNTGTIAIGNGSNNTRTIGIGNTGGSATQTVAVGDSGGASSLALAAGTGGLQITTLGTGILGVGNNAVAQTLQIGNATGATSVLIQSGTGALSLQSQGTGGINIGNNAVAQTLTIGNATGATTVNIQSGTGGINLGATGVTTTLNGGIIFVPSTGFSSGTNATITASLLTNNSAVPVTATASGLTFTLPTTGIGSAGRIVYLTNAGSNSFLLNTGSTVMNFLTTSTATLYWNGTAWSSAGLDAGVTAMGALDGQAANSNGATILDNTLYLQSASATAPGLVNTTTQTLAGAKTFTSPLTVQTTTNSTTALQVQSSNGSNVLTGDTVTGNLITNADFVSGLTGWSPKGTGPAALSQSSTVSYNGTSSMQVVTTAHAGDGATYAFSLASSTQYAFSVYVEDPGSSFATFEIGRSENGSTDTSCATAQPVGTIWTRINCTFTTGTTSGSTYLYLKQTDATVRTFYVDGAELTAGSSAGVYGGKLAVAGTLTIGGSMANATSDSTVGLEVIGSGDNNLDDTPFDVRTFAGIDLLNTNAAVLNTTVSGGSAFWGTTAMNVTAISTAGALKVNGTNSTTAFQVQNASSASIFDVDTTDGFVGINTSTPTSRLTVAWGSGDSTPTVAVGSSSSGDNQIALNANSYSNSAIVGTGNTGDGIDGFSTGKYGIYGQTSASSYAAIYGYNNGNGNALQGYSAGTGIGLLAQSAMGEAGVFNTTSTSDANATLAAVATFGQASTTNTLDIQSVNSGTYTNMFTVGATGKVTATNLANSTTAFQVQNAGGASTIFDVDTTDGYAGINTTTPDQALTVVGNFDVNNSTTPTKSYRFRTSGSALDLEASGAPLYVSTWSGNNFTGTQYDQFIFSNTGGDISVQRGMYPATNNTYALGSTTNYWANIYGTHLVSTSLDTTSGGTLSIGITNAASINIGGVVTVSTTSDTVTVGAGATGETNPDLLILDNATTEPGTAINGAMYYNSSTNSFRCGQNSNWVSCNGLVWSVTSQSANITATSETTFGNPYVLPVSDCQPGVVYLITANGYYTEPATAQAMTLYLVENGTTLLNLNGSTAGLPASGSANWYFNATVTCYTSTTVMVTGQASWGTSSSSTTMTADGSAHTGTTAWSAAAGSLTMEGSWNTTAGTTFKMNQFIVQRLGPS